MKDEKKSAVSTANKNKHHPGTQPDASAGGHHGILDSIESEVAPEVSPMLKFIVSHGRKIALAFIIVSLALVGTGIYKSYSGSEKNKVQAELGNILIEQDPKVKIVALEEFLKKKPAGFEGQALLAIAYSAVQTEDYVAEASAWKRYASISSGPMKTMAVFGEANAISFQGKNPEAIAILETLTSNEAAEVRFTALLRISLLYEQDGDYEKAIAAIERSLSDPESQADKDAYQQKINYLRHKMDNK